MKKSLFLSLIALLGFGLASCSEPTASSSSSPSIGEVEEIIITGSHNVTVGRTIRLSASGEVAWSSLDESVATVDDSGVVTGIASGNATIRATSVISPSIYADWEVTVSPTIPEAVNIKIEGEGLISQEGDVYNLALGKEVIASLDCDPSFATSYTLSYSDENYSGSIDVENISSTSIRLTPNRVVESVTLVFRILYGADNAESKQDMVTLNVLDENAEALFHIEEKLASTLEGERNSLTGVTITKTSKRGNEVLSSDALAYSSYLDATYLVETDEEGVMTNYFSGIRDEHYYLFSYDPGNGNAIGEIHQSVSSNDPSYLGYLDNAKAPFLPSTSPSYGLGNIIAKLFDGSYTLPNGFLSFGDTTAYNNMIISEEENEFSATSSFRKDGVDYSLSLVVEFSNGLISRYYFSESYVSGEETYSYVEQTSGFTYGNKVADSSENNASYLDFDNYYFKDSLSVVDLSGSKDEAGRYDYSDLSKFGGTLTTDSEGNAHYSLPYNRSLPLTVTSPNGGNPLIDEVTIAASNDEIDIPSLASGGIYSFSAKEGEVNGVHTMMEGETKFTFTSGKNALSCTITIEFYIPSVSALNADNLPTNNDFGEVFRGEVSSDYIFLNAEPDDSSLTFEIVDEEGTNVLSGIEIYSYPSNNVYGYPSYGYFVKANANGEYSFRFRVVGTSVVTDEVFSITVIDPISASTIKASIVDEAPTYINKGSTATTTVKFLSETAMSLSYVSTGVEEITKTVPYHIEDGHIVIDSASDGSNYAFGDTSFYYQKIMAGNIPFARDFSSITLYLSYETETTEDKFMPVLLTKDRSAEISYDDISGYLNGKTFTDSVGAWLTDTAVGGMYTSSVTFTSTSGTLTLTKNADGSKITFSFDYAYDPASKSLTYSNCVSSVTSLTLDGAYSSNLKTSDNTLNFRIYSGSIPSIFTISLLG